MDFNAGSSINHKLYINCNKVTSSLSEKEKLCLKHVLAAGSNQTELKKKKRPLEVEKKFPFIEMNSEEVKY